MPNHIAVVVPSYARPKRLRSCLEALAQQEGGPFPAYVVDDGSPEDLAPICAAFPWVRCLRQRNAGPAAARNAGAEAARADGADFLCFTDDDCRPRPEWIREFRFASAGKGEECLFGGRVENALPANAYASASQSLCNYLYDYFGATEGRAPFFTSNNIACSAAGFARIGGFDASFPLAAAEDRDFGLRWRDRTGPLVYVPEAIVEHAHPLTFRRFWHQHANYGRGARHLHRMMSSRGDARPRREPVAFYAGLILCPLRHRKAGALGQSVLMGLSQVAMIAGYLSERRASG